MKLWHVLTLVAIVALALWKLPERIGLPVFLVIEGSLIVALIGVLASHVIRRRWRKGC